MAKILKKDKSNRVSLKLRLSRDALNKVHGQWK